MRHNHNKGLILAIFATLFANSATAVERSLKATMERLGAATFLERKAA